MKTVLITGCSSGYGLETARYFHSQGWNVIATMRTPREGILPQSERIRLLPLDVTKSESIAAAVEASGPIDVLVNNAGIGLFGVFEATPMAQARSVFATNTFGVMAMTQAVLPQFRAQRSGVVVNVTSSAALAPMPLVAVYTASKMAIEGFTGSLAHELEAFNVRVKLVEPGYAPTTRFSQNTELRIDELIPEAYAPFAQPIFAAFAQPAAVTTEFDVAEAVWRAANDVLRAAPLPGRSRRGGAGSGAMRLLAPIAWCSAGWCGASTDNRFCELPRPRRRAVRQRQLVPPVREILLCLISPSIASCSRPKLAAIHRATLPAPACWRRSCHAGGLPRSRCHNARIGPPCFPPTARRTGGRLRNPRRGIHTCLWYPRPFRR